MTVRINKQKINLREKLAGVEDKVNFDEVVRGLGEYTGNVGIGTTNPEHQLHIKNDSGVGDFKIEGTQPRIWLKETDQTDLDILIRNHAGQFRIDVTKDDGNLFSTPFLINNTNGNVGIGTTNPSGKLQVNDFELISGFTVQTIATGITVYTSADMQGVLSNGDTVRISGIVYTINNLTSATFQLNTQATIDASGLAIYLYKESLTIKDGNVGIGVTNPSNLLELKTASGSGKMADIAVYSDGNDNNATSSIFLGQSLTRRAEITAIRAGTGNSHALAFSTNGGAAAPEERLRITPTGNVGIGTTNPGSYKLNVNGTTFCTAGVWSGSDDRVKHNEQPIIGALETLSKITPKKYIKTTEMYDADHDFELDADGNPIDENGEPVEHRIEAGVIAQQVLTVDELAFAVSPEGVDEDGTVTSPHGLDYNSLFTYAIAAIQEQQKLINDLKSRIETLEQQ